MISTTYVAIGLSFSKPRAIVPSSCRPNKSHFKGGCFSVAWNAGCGSFSKTGHQIKRSLPVHGADVTKMESGAPVI
jgi:hypothetical protein